MRFLDPLPIELDFLAFYMEAGLMWKWPHINIRKSVIQSETFQNNSLQENYPQTQILMHEEMNEYAWWFDDDFKKEIFSRVLLYQKRNISGPMLDDMDLRGFGYFSSFLWRGRSHKVARQPWARSSAMQHVLVRRESTWPETNIRTVRSGITKLQRQNYFRYLGLQRIYCVWWCSQLLKIFWSCFIILTVEIYYPIVLI